MGLTYYSLILFSLFAVDPMQRGDQGKADNEKNHCQEKNS